MLRAPFIPNAEIRAADARRRDGLPYGLRAGAVPRAVPALPR